MRGFAEFWQEAAFALAFCGLILIAGCATIGGIVVFIYWLTHGMPMGRGFDTFVVHAVATFIVFVTGTYWGYRRGYRNGRGGGC